jgi:hypothetical protein
MKKEEAEREMVEALMANWTSSWAAVIAELIVMREGRNES